jgi:hypothetical protein
METSPHEITQQLIAWSQGDAAAFDKLIPAVYQELRRMAKRCSRSESAGVAYRNGRGEDIYVQAVGERTAKNLTPGSETANSGSLFSRRAANRFSIDSRRWRYFFDGSTRQND